MSDNVTASSNATEPDMESNIPFWEFQLNQFITAQQDFPNTTFVPSMPDAWVLHGSLAYLSADQIFDNSMMDYVFSFIISAILKYTSIRHLYPSTLFDVHLKAEQDALAHCNRLLRTSKNVSNPETLKQDLKQKIENVYERIRLSHNQKRSNIDAKSKAKFINGFESSVQERFISSSNSLVKKFWSSEEIDSFIKHHMDQCDTYRDILQQLYTPEEGEEVESIVNELRSYIENSGKQLIATNKEHEQATTTYLNQLVLSLNGNYIQDIKNKPFKYGSAELLQNIDKDKAKILQEIDLVCHEAAMDTEKFTVLKGHFEKTLEETEKALKDESLKVLKDEQHNLAMKTVNILKDHN